jgi:hypothetical protein
MSNGRGRSRERGRERMETNVSEHLYVAFINFRFLIELLCLGLHAKGIWVSGKGGGNAGIGKAQYTPGSPAQDLVVGRLHRCEPFINITRAEHDFGVWVGGGRLRRGLLVRRMWPFIPLALSLSLSQFTQEYLGGNKEKSRRRARRRGRLLHCTSQAPY